MKQKIVVKVSVCDQKTRSKALKVAVGIAGVESVGLVGNDKSQIEIVGDGVDPVHLVNLLRKKIGRTQLVSLSDIGGGGGGGDQKKAAPGPPAPAPAPAPPAPAPAPAQSAPNNKVQQVVLPYDHHSNYTIVPQMDPYYYRPVHDPYYYRADPTSCSIM